MIGTAPTGGAVALVGDDPAAKSSTLPCSSEMALAGLAMPTFYPADPAEALRARPARGRAVPRQRPVVGHQGGHRDGRRRVHRPGRARTGRRPTCRTCPAACAPTATSRAPGCSAPSSPSSSAASSSPGCRSPSSTSAAAASTRSRGPRGARIGLVAAGKTYLDLRQALTALGLTEADLERHGIRLLKLGVIYPLEPSIVAEFADGLDEIVVIEDKRAFLEDAVKSVLYGRADAPAVYGKRVAGRLRAVRGRRRARRGRGRRRASPATSSPPGIPVTAAGRRASGSCCRWRSACRTSAPAARTTPPPRSRRAPWSAAGSAATPWSRSCRQSRSARSSGCARWAARARSGWASRRSSTQRHLVQNLGDGTFAHSGSLAIRAAVAAGREHHLQAAAQLRRRDDRRPAGGRRAAARPAARAARGRGRAQDRRHHRRPGPAAAPAWPRAPTSGTATT